MFYVQDLEEALGPGRLARVDLQLYLGRALIAAQGLVRGAESELQAVLSLAGKLDDLDLIQEKAARFSACDEVLVLGIGGSSLGGQVLAALADPARRAKVRFLEGADPHTLGWALSHSNWAKTGLLLISKSGGTVETLAQGSVLLPALLASPGGAKRALAITDSAATPLGQVATKAGLEILPHDPNLGGRFSVFSSTGLLPAAILGLDLLALRQGAGDVAETLDHLNCPPAKGAALSVALLELVGASQQVFFTYGDRLTPLAAWYRQLWAESLGKGGRGQTPLAASGPVDQHSLLQLFLDGPKDKCFTLLNVDSKGEGPKLSGGELEGRTAGDLLWAEARATGDVLSKARQLPLRRITLEKFDERALGQLLMHFILETLIAGQLMDINPFGQPAVEEGKVFARHYLKDMGR